jgi:hypothetical protein
MNELISVSKLSEEVKAEVLKRANSHYWEDEKRLFEVAKLLLPYIDDEKFCQSFDYLKCKMDHQNQFEKLKEGVRYHGEFEELLHEVRHDLRRGGQMILDNIRYGKRSEEIDALLTKVAMLEKVFSSSRPNINVNTDSPSRCSKCNNDCLSAYRIMYGIVSPIIETLKNGQSK